MTDPQQRCRRSTTRTEPSLDALLTDQTALTLMRADHVTADEVRRLVRQAAARIRRRDQFPYPGNAELLWPLVPA